jgi:propionyl-CoA carboxylase beta chain
LAASSEPEVRRVELTSDYKEAFANPYQAAALGFVDEVLLPSKSRERLIGAFNSLENKRVSPPPKKHGNIPL